MATPPLNTKVTRDDWVDAAVAALSVSPADELKVQVLAERLGVSRTSCYWYFGDRDGLLAAVVERWRANTAAVVERAGRPAGSIAGACLGVFECWADRSVFDVALDHAIRDWGRRDGAIGAEVRAADDERTAALRAMFERHGYAPDEAVVRARIVYHSQLGLYAVGAEVPVTQRNALLPTYLTVMTGTSATDAELAAFHRYVEHLDQVQPTSPQP